MRAIRIDKYANGFHDYQTANTDFPLFEGWAVVPDALKTPNWPYADIEVEDIDGVPTVTGWTPLPIPQDTKEEETIK